MTNLDIRLNIKSLSYYSSSVLRTKDEETLLLMIKDFAVYIRHLYLDSIEEEMNSPRYKGEWEPRSDPGYLEYLGVTPKDNILSIMEEALLIEKIGVNYLIRFDSHYLYPGSRIPLVRVLRAIEYGTSDFHARPILIKCNRLITSHIRSLWRGYLLSKGAI